MANHLPHKPSNGDVPVAAIGSQRFELAHGAGVKPAEAVFVPPRSPDQAGPKFPNGKDGLHSITVQQKPRLPEGVKPQQQLQIIGLG